MRGRRLPDPIPGQRFGRWTFLREGTPRVPKIGSITRRYFCRCDCGREFLVHRGGLLRGKSTQCKWCSRTTTHGLSKDNIYWIWSGMRSRCENPASPNYARYGGRGIRVCERWQKFENFLADIPPRPSLQHTLDRKDTDGNYEPGNVRWATAHEQQMNRRDTKYLTLNGETLHINEWASRLGINVATLWARIHCGWSVTETLTRSLSRHGNNHKETKAA